MLHSASEFLVASHSADEVPAPVAVADTRIALELRAEPIVHGLAPEQADDITVLRRLRHEVAGALHELMENELARRAGLEL